MKLTGAAIPVSRGMRVLQAAPAAYPYRSAAEGFGVDERLRRLRRIWSAVRRDFDRARALLPTPLTEREGRVSQLNKWLDHNELGLALDELESLGEDNAAGPAYWECLQSAATRMGLTEQTERLSRRAASDAEQGAAADGGS